MAWRPIDGEPFYCCRINAGPEYGVVHYFEPGAGRDGVAHLRCRECAEGRCPHCMASRTGRGLPPIE
jgi:hypothetical protein